MTSMRTKLAVVLPLALSGLVAAGTAADAAPAQAGPAAAPASAAPASAACGSSAPANKDPGGYHQALAPGNSAANERSGTSTSCAALGSLQPTDQADYYCYTVDSTYTYTWTYLKNQRTGVRGWVRDDLLKDNGSYTSC